MRSTSTALAPLAALALLSSTMAGCQACTRPPDGFVWTKAPPRAFSPGKEHVQVVFGGDVNLGRAVAKGIEKQGKGDPHWLWEKVRDVVNNADLVFANLECALTDTDDGKVEKLYNIRGDTRNVDVLPAGNIGVVSVANNHAMDFGWVGFFSTLKTLAAANIQVTGVLEEGGQQPLILDVGAMKVGFVAWNARTDEWRHFDYRPRDEIYNRDEPERFLEQIKALRPKVDQLVVSIHWGPELAYAPEDWQIEHAHAMVDAGADFVIGHHPHVEQPVEVYKDKLIAYSLGDFAFDKKTDWIRARTEPRFLLVVDFDGKTMTSWKMVPITHDDWFRPIPSPGQDLESMIMKPAAKPAWRASAAIEDAKVVRDGEACSSWEDRRERLQGGFLRWVDRRWVCPTEEKQPGDSVGPTVELSKTVARAGLWASPSGTVAISYDDVTLGKELRGVAGWPDWVVEREAKATPPERSAATVVVKVGGDVVHTEEVPFSTGWHAFSVDTSARAGQKAAVVVEVNGKRRAAPGFLVDLEVPAP